MLTESSPMPVLPEFKSPDMSFPNHVSTRPALAAELIAALLILTLTYAAFSKLMERNFFASALSQLPVIGSGARLLSIILPASELLISFMLFFPRLRKPGLFAAFLLMLVFTVYVGGMMLFVPYLPCSCGGVLNQLGWGGHLALNLALTALAFYGYRLEKRTTNTEDFIAINRES